MHMYIHDIGAWCYIRTDGVVKGVIEWIVQ